MKSIYITDENGNFKKTDKHEKSSWIDLVSPTLEEIKEVASITKTDEDLLTKLMDDEELPRIENGDNATLIVIDTPYITDIKYKHRYNTEPLGIIINNDGYFITISSKKQVILDDFKEGKIKDFDVRKKTKFIIQILLKVAATYQRELVSINEYINSKEKTLYKSTNNRELIDLLNVEKTLVYFTTSLKANDAVLEKLSKGTILKLYEEMSNIYREILTSMTDTYATIISNNLNDIMKFLAGITIVFSVPTMVASFIGMNVPLGNIGASSYSFILIIAFSVILSLIIAFILKRKNML